MPSFTAFLKEEPKSEKIPWISFTRIYRTNVVPTTRETVLAALHARLQSLAALTLRDEVLPERIPATGLLILRDGQPGEPEVTLSPLRYHYQHRVELEVVVQAGSGRATKPAGGAASPSAANAVAAAITASSSIAPIPTTARTPTPP